MPEVITNNLDLWSSALLTRASAGRGNNGKLEAYGIKKLRELVLELAVRGKLVSQDPNDEPASALLERIAEDKARLLAEGGGYKTLTMPEVTDQETPFVIPSTWEWVRLGDLGSIFNGNSISERVKETKYTGNNGGLPFIATKDVGYGWQPLDYKNGVSIPEGEPNFKVAHQAAVLICCEGGSAGKKCGITDRDICFGNKLYALEPLAGVSSHFLLANYLTPTFFAQFAAKMTGIIGGISLANFNQLLVPSPPVNEQHRIVTKVDELMALCDQLEQQQTHSIEAHQTLVEALLGTLIRVESQPEFSAAWARVASHFDTLFTTEASIDQLKQTILQLAVMGKLVPQDPNDEPASVLLERIKENRDGKIKKERVLPEISGNEKLFVLPALWSWARLGDYAVVLSGNAFSSEDFNNGNGAKVVKITNAGVGEFVETKDFLPLEFVEKYKNFIVEEDDLILALTRPYISDGLKISKCPGSYHKALLNQRVAAIRTIANVDYLYAYMQSRFVLSVYKDRFGSSGLQPNLKVSDVTSLLVPVPPENEQHRIVAKVDELMALCDSLKARLDDAQTTQLHLADAIVEQAVC